jgi:hypothetical protein
LQTCVQGDIHPEQANEFWSAEDCSAQIMAATAPVATALGPVIESQACAAAVRAMVARAIKNVIADHDRKAVRIVTEAIFVNVVARCMGNEVSLFTSTFASKVSRV